MNQIPKKRHFRHYFRSLTDDFVRITEPHTSDVYTEAPPKTY